ncbi:hypothetical protein BS47DRAFT_1356318, partial [Hydnum rufescens UP504]
MSINANKHSLHENPLHLLAETLIVWTEPDSTDFALSFQDVEGCAEIWDFILKVQHYFRTKDSDDLSLSPLASGSGSSQSHLTVASIIASHHLPKPALGIIGNVETAIKVIAKMLHGCECISSANAHTTQDYIKSLIDVMEQAEDLESLTDLHALYSIMHTIHGLNPLSIVSMNDHGINYILHEDVFLDVIGILEYDPKFPTCKYQDFVKNLSKFTQVIKIKDDTIQWKIYQIYQLKYLKDIILMHVLDELTSDVLNTFIWFNQINIKNYITQDATFLADLLWLLTLSEGMGFGAAPIPLTNPTAPSNPNMFNTNSLSNERQHEQALLPLPSSTSPPLSSVTMTQLNSTQLS